MYTRQCVRYLSKNESIDRVSNAASQYHIDDVGTNVATDYMDDDVGDDDDEDDDDGDTITILIVPFIHQDVVYSRTDIIQYFE